MPFSLICLSIAIVYFAYVLGNVGNKIPQLSKTADNVEKHIPLLLQELEGYRLLIPDILAETKAYRENIPVLLKRVDDLQSEIKVIRKEIPKTIDKTLPPLISQAEKIQRQIEQFNQQLPEMLKTVNQTTATLEKTNQQVANIVALIPEVLAESEIIRANIPGYFDRADMVVSGAKSVTEDAGKGLFTGLIKGIISTPFDLLFSSGKMLGVDLKYKHLYTDEDFKQVQILTEELLKSEKESRKAWRNPDSKNQGTVTVKEPYMYQGKKCRLLVYEIKASKGKKETINKDVCLNEKEQWQQAD